MTDEVLHGWTNPCPEAPTFDVEVMDLPPLKVTLPPWHGDPVQDRVRFVTGGGPMYDLTPDDLLLFAYGPSRRYRADA